MGFFSWNCDHCHESIKAPYDCEPANHNLAVAILRNGSVIKGNYDGYGVVGNTNLTDAQPTMYHEHCWEAAGQPDVWGGESEAADDQGYFYDREDDEDLDDIEDGWEDDYDEEDWDDDWDDVDADADTLRSAGMGTDEDYGLFGPTEDDYGHFG